MTVFSLNQSTKWMTAQESRQRKCEGGKRSVSVRLSSRWGIY